MNRSREYRRHQKFRFRNRVKRIVKAWGIRDPKNAKRIESILERTRPVCGCCLCSSHKRKKFLKGKHKYSLIEYKSLLSEREQLLELKAGTIQEEKE